MADGLVRLRDMVLSNRPNDDYITRRSDSMTGRKNDNLLVLNNKSGAVAAKPSDAFVFNLKLPQNTCREDSVSFQAT